MHVSGHVGARTDIAFGKSCLSRIGAEAGLRLSVPRVRRSAPRLRRDALLIRGPSSNSLMGPGSAEQREKRCTVRDTTTYAASTPHHSAMNSAVALVDFRNESRSTYSLNPCIAAPLAPKHRLGML